MARYIDSQFRGTDVETLGLGVLLLLKPILAASLVLLVVGGILKSIRRDVPAWMHGPLVTALSMAITLAVALSLKVAVGRSQVYPTFIPDHLYTLRPFHGGGDYEAFPSATLAVSAAGLTVVWLRVSRLRSLCVTALLLVEAAILLTNGHWLSDTLAGTFLGGFVGWAVCVRAVAWTRPR